MTTINQDIRGALQIAAAAVSGFPSSAQIAYEGRKFTPTIGTAWARMKYAPASARAAVVGAALIVHRGLFYIELYWPAANEGGPGTGDLESLADAVRAAFRPGNAALSNGAAAVTIEYAERGDVTEDPDPNWLRCAVTVGWNCYSTN